MTLDTINDLSEIKLGVLNDDINNVKYYLYEAKDITYVACDSFEDMLSKLESNDITHMAIPKTIYLDEILSNDLNIVYHISELYKKYVITVNKDNTLKSILNKYHLPTSCNITKDELYKYISLDKKRSDKE